MKLETTINDNDLRDSQLLTGSIDPTARNVSGVGSAPNIVTYLNACQNFVEFALSIAIRVAQFSFFLL